MKILYVLVGLFLGAILVFFLGCATGPRNVKEMHPFLSSRDGDPRVGLIILEGEPTCNIEFKDAAGRVVEEWNEAGKSPLAVKFNGQYRPRLYAHRLEEGRCEVRIRPFYYTANWFIKRQLVELPVQRSSVYVDRRANDYDGQYTGRHWGWILRINTGEIPRVHFSGPQINLTGAGLPGLILDWIGGRR